jgi:diphthine-ammonia ligase
MRLGVLFSGGKDSTYALYKAMAENEVVCLISMLSNNPSSYMFHTPNINLTKLQAEAIGLPLLTSPTEGKKEEELADLKRAIAEAKKKYNIEGLVTGAVASVYQAERIKKICDDLSLACVNPLWHKDPEKLMREMINSGFKFILSSVAAEGLDKSWLGREITLKDVDRLVAVNKKLGIHIAFEGGEAESLVVSAPIFKKKLEIIEAETSMETENTGIYKIKKAGLNSP